jgi:hypothetical protein
MSDTPKTQLAETTAINCVGNEKVVHAYVCRELERELNQAKATIADLGAQKDTLGVELKAAIVERDIANATIAELERDLCSWTPWQPIEKPPSNKGNFLVTNGCFYHRGELNEDGEWVSYHTNGYLPFTPTHWMEIPELNP